MVEFCGFRGRRGQVPDGRQREELVGGGLFAPQAISRAIPRATGGTLALLLLSACAVGPDFKVPLAPAAAGYTPETHPAATASVSVAGGGAQRFEPGRDIPGEWWTVFHSKDINGLIDQALQANPNLQAAQAALWQARRISTRREASCFLL